MTPWGHIFRVFLKFLSNRNFVKSTRLWIWRTHIMGFSPSFLGGAGTCYPTKFLKTVTLENTFPGILDHEIQTLEEWISCNYTVKTIFLKERQSDISILMQLFKQKVEWYFLYLSGATANEPGKHCLLTTCKHGTYLKDYIVTRRATKVAGKTWQRSQRTLLAAGSDIQPRISS